MASISLAVANGFVFNKMDARKASCTISLVKPKSAAEGVTENEALEALAKSRKMELVELKALLGIE